MNYLSSVDLLAYLDWSGLRPMTELEFEKICRGPSLPVLNEFAWGNATITSLASIINAGRTDETIGTPGANADLSFGVSAVVRVGIFAGASTNRIQAGAAFYGAMEMSGNVSERIISISTTEGKNYLGNHGNGILYFTGDPNETSWPSAISLGYRGGGWLDGTLVGTISDRHYSDSNANGRDIACGGRGVRSTQ
jgi:formylglycine-generating enzyme required for sulfatase activity